MRRILLLLSFSIGFVASAADRIFPLPLKTEIVSDYGVRSDPFLGRPAMHTGLDLRAATGDIVSASQSGYVTVAGWDRRGYGQLIEICDGKDGKGWCTRYGHNNSVSVKVGDKVSVGQAIAEVGSSGRSMGPHAHFEILKDGKQIDPAEHVEGLKFELGDIEKISAENREILGKFSEARCESSELSSHDQDDEEKMEGSRRARDEKQKSLEKDMTGLKALKIQSRAGWYMTFFPIEVKREGGKIIVGYLGARSESFHQLVIDQKEKSDPIMKWGKKNVAVKPGLTLAMLSSHIQDPCYAAFMTKNYFDSQRSSPVLSTKPTPSASATN